jgi:hypothetical protein
MGTIEKGFMGGFKGKLGTAVGATWKGLNVIRSRPPRKRTGEPSDSQLEAQAIFALLSNFLRPLADLFDRTYKKSAVGMSGVNKAFSENKRAFTGTFPDLTIDYPKVVLGRGSLQNLQAPAATSAVTGRLQFTWTDNSGKNKALSSDLVFVAAYSPDLDEWEFHQDAAPRNAGSFVLDVPAFAGKPVQTYMGVMSADKKKIADSQYTGVVNIL